MYKTRSGAKAFGEFAISARSAAMDYVLGNVTSRDGTQIGYRQIGSGPGVVLVQGAMGTARNYDELARLLAKDFTVYVPDRRGQIGRAHV